MWATATLLQKSLIDLSEFNVTKGKARVAVQCLQRGLSSTTSLTKVVMIHLRDDRLSNIYTLGMHRLVLVTLISHRIKPTIT